MDVSYHLESYPELGVDEFIDVLERSTLAERRPVGEPETIRGMLEHADVIVTARSGGLLVGISRAITDHHFCTYLSDLAVDREYQRRGIGKELIRRTHLNGRASHHADPAGRSQGTHLLSPCRNGSPRLMLGYSPHAQNRHRRAESLRRACRLGIWMVR